MFQWSLEWMKSTPLSANSRFHSTDSFRISRVLPTIADTTSKEPDWLSSMPMSITASKLSSSHYDGKMAGQLPSVVLVIHYDYIDGKDGAVSRQAKTAPARRV